jgi:lipopolysaccharide/colanic/teichoic acid biosynthesis glycosyltransferase
MTANEAFLTTDADHNHRTNQFYVRDGWVREDRFVTPQGRAMNCYRHDLSDVDARSERPALASPSTKTIPQQSQHLNPRDALTLADHSLVLFRARDILVAVVGLALAMPLIGAAAIAIVVTSGPPILFRQERVGQHGETFRIHKLRTMRRAPGGSLVSAASDPRITHIGKYLRATKIDELPQLIDVLQGHMSVVGPRPEVPRYVALWPPHLRTEILSIAPGITDPCSILFRHESALLADAEEPERTYIEDILPVKARAYAEYVRTRSLLGDFYIILGTIGAIAKRSPGAANRVKTRLSGTRQARPSATPFKGG